MGEGMFKKSNKTTMSEALYNRVRGASEAAYSKPVTGSKESPSVRRVNNSVGKKVARTQGSISQLGQKQKQQQAANYRFSPASAMSTFSYPSQVQKTNSRLKYKPTSTMQFEKQHQTVIVTPQARQRKAIKTSA